MDSIELGMFYLEGKALQSSEDVAFSQMQERRRKIPDV
jgi:hypothetical protein